MRNCCVCLYVQADSGFESKAARVLIGNERCTLFCISFQVQFQDGQMVSKITV